MEIPQSYMQGRFTARVSVIDIGLSLDEWPERLEMAIMAGFHKRSVPIIVPKIRLCTLYEENLIVSFERTT